MNKKTTRRSVKQRRRSHNKKTVRRSIKQRRSNKRLDGEGTTVTNDPNDPGKVVVPNRPNDPVKVVPNPNDPGKVVPNLPNDPGKVVPNLIEEQEKYSKYLLTHYEEGFKDCKSDNLLKIEKYIIVLSQKFNEWKNSKCEFFDLKSNMHFNFKLRYTLRKCNGEKHNRVALNIMRIGFFNTDLFLKKSLSSFTDDETVNKGIINQFNEIDEIKFDMQCNIFERVINLFIEKLYVGQVLYLENVLNACWQQVLESMKFQTCNNGNDYYYIKFNQSNN